jgi:hypothetical protein
VEIKVAVVIKVAPAGSMAVSDFVEAGAQKNVGEGSVAILQI